MTKCSILDVAAVLDQSLQDNTHNEIGALSPADHLVGFKWNLSIYLQHFNPLGQVLSLNIHTVFSDV